MLRAGSGTAQPKGFQIAGDFGFLEFQAFPPHEQQSEDIAEINAVRLGLALEAVEAIEQQVVVKSRPPGSV